MAHYIRGLVADYDFLKGYAETWEIPRPARLAVNNLGFLATTDDFLDRIYERHPAGEMKSPLVYLNGALDRHLRELSASEKVIYLETEYFGGEGTQGAVVYHQGGCLMPAECASHGVINQALQLIGVQRLPNIDEFDTVRLGLYRNNEDWIESLTG